MVLKMTLLVFLEIFMKVSFQQFQGVSMLKKIYQTTSGAGLILAQVGRVTPPQGLGSGLLVLEKRLTGVLKVDSEPLHGGGVW